MTKIAANPAADFRATALELRTAAAPNKGFAMICAENFVVVTDFGALRFSTERNAEGKLVATSTGFGLPHLTNRFAREDAETLAKVCNGRAMFWRDACNEAAAEYERMADMFEGLAA